MKANNYQNIITAILFAYASIVLSLRIFLVFSYLPEIGGGMAINMIYGIQHLTQTGVLYVNPEDAPFSIIQYTPLYYYFLSTIEKIINPSGDVHNLMMLHRIVCLLSNILYCIIISYAIKKLFPSLRNNLIFAAGLIIFIITPNLNFERLDNLYLLFSVAALVSFMFYLNQLSEKGKKNLLLITITGLFCSLALLTKQTAVWIIGLIGLWLLLMDRSPKALLIFSLMVLLPFFGFIAIILPDHAIDLKLNIIDGLKNGIGISWFYNVFIKGYFIRFTLLIIFGIYIGGWLLAEKKPGLKSFIGFAILYFFLAAFAFSFKYGATQNYYIEFTIMIIFGICFLIEKNNEIHKPYLPFVALYIPFFLMTCANDKGWKSISKLNSSKKDYKECANIASYIQKNIQPGNFIYSTSHTENCLNLMLVNQALFPCREVAFVQTYPLGVFKFDKFQQLLDNGNLQFIIDKKGEFPKTILYAEPKYFIPDTSIGNYTIYRNASSSIGKFTSNN